MPSVPKPKDQQAPEFGIDLAGLSTPKTFQPFPGMVVSVPSVKNPTPKNVLRFSGSDERKEMAAEFRSHFVYVSPYSSAHEKWLERRGVRRAVEAYFADLGAPMPADLASRLNSHPHIALFRPLAAARREDEALALLAAARGLNPLWMACPGATRVKDSDGLHRSYFLQQRERRRGKTTLVEQAVKGFPEHWHGMMFSEARTLDNLPIFDWHIRDRQRSAKLRDHNCSVYDYTEWSQAVYTAGITKTALRLLLAVGHLFLVDNFDQDGEHGVAYDENRLVEVVIPAITLFVSQFRYPPMVVRQPSGGRMAHYPLR